LAASAEVLTGSVFSERQLEDQLAALAHEIIIRPLSVVSTR
jgi:hypothetical protein